MSAPVPCRLENPEDFSYISQELAAATGQQPTLTPEVLCEFVAGALSLLYAADASADVAPMRGVFSDAVIAQCARRLGSLQGEVPQSASVHLVGAPSDEDGRPVLRAHITLQLLTRSGQRRVERQFWDLALDGALVTVSAQASCPNCGAPLAPGTMFCSHCGQDVRAQEHVPLAVSALKLY